MCRGGGARPLVHILHKSPELSVRLIDFGPLCTVANLNAENRIFS